MKSKLFIIFLAMIFFGLFGYYIVRSGHYPIAIVNGKWVSASQFRKEHRAFFSYYRQVANVNNVVIEDERAFTREIGRLGLDRIIENILVGQELENLLRDQLDVAVEKKISEQNLNIVQVSEAAGNIYGLNFSDFRDVVLKPVAEKEILESRLSKQDDNLQNWLATARESAKVIIFSSLFSWEGNQIVFQ